MKNKNARILKILISVLVIALLGSGLLIYDRLSVRSDIEITKEEGERVLHETVKGLPLNVAKLSAAMVEKLSLSVDGLSYGSEKNVVLHCTYETVDIKSLYIDKKDSLFTDVYHYYVTESESKNVSATHIRLRFQEDLIPLLDGCAPLSGKIDIQLYDTGTETLTVWLDDNTVNTLFGGYLDVREDIKNTTEITYEGEQISIVNNGTLRKGITDCFGLSNYSSEKPDVSSPLGKMWNSFTDEFYRNFIKDNMWEYLADGLLVTLEITGLSLILGIAIGFVVSVVRATYEKEGKLKILNSIFSLYVSVVRGVPLMIQLLVLYYVFLLPIGMAKFPAAILCFGLNSGAYVSEIIRGGIMAVDGGQMEAGRSLGFGYVPTMVFIILPQAFKAVLPALCNEFIALLKETSIAFYIGVADLTMGGLKIRSITYSDFMPLIAIAIIYLILVVILTKLVGILERRLRRSER